MWHLRRKFFPICFIIKSREILKTGTYQNPRILTRESGFTRHLTRHGKTLGKALSMHGVFTSLAKGLTKPIAKEGPRQLARHTREDTVRSRALPSAFNVPGQYQGHLPRALPRHFPKKGLHLAGPFEVLLQIKFMYFTIVFSSMWLHILYCNNRRF